jgi:hypothetical protein
LATFRIITDSDKNYQWMLNLVGERKFDEKQNNYTYIHPVSKHHLRATLTCLLLLSKKHLSTNFIAEKPSRQTLHYTAKVITNGTQY